jgi:hypothetical protein
MISYTYPMNLSMISELRDIIPVIAYDVIIRYMPLMSVLRDIIAIRYQIFYDISAYVMVPVRRAGAGWGRHAGWGRWTRVQLNGDGLDAAHGLVALAAARVMHCGRFVVIKKSTKSARRGRRCGLCSPCRQSADAQPEALSTRLG